MSCLNVQYVPQQPYGNGEPNLRGECSSNGVCNATLGQCICEAGWTGLSDFFGNPQTDCQIFVLGIQIEYALLLLVSIISIKKQYPGIKKRYQDFYDARRKALTKGKKYTLWNNTAAVAVVAWWTLIYPFFIGTCIIRMAFLQERIGVTFALTFFFAGMKIPLYIVSSIYQPYLFKILLKGSQLNQTGGLTRLINFINIAAVFSAILYTVTSLVPFISVFDRNLQLETYLSYQILSALSLYYNTVLAYAIYWKAEKLLNQSYSVSGDAKTLKLKATLKGFQFTVGINTFIFGSLYIMQAAWPFWYNLHEYFHAISWLPFIKFINDISLGTQEAKSPSPKDKSSVEDRDTVNTLNKTSTITGDIEPTSMSV